MSAIILNVQLANECFAELCGMNVKLWIGCGLPHVYDGSIEGLLQVYPVQFNELLKCGFIKHVQ